MAAPVQNYKPPAYYWQGGMTGIKDKFPKEKL